jgi:polyhydroxyalkanoate synthesis repressor PhaR
MHAQRRQGPRLIKRYGNRKLYDVQASQYITLEGIRELVRSGEDIRVVDNDSDEDLTAVTFAQIIFEDAKRQNGSGSLPLFRWLIERGDEAMRDFMRNVERGREALDSVREATEKRVQQLVGKRPPRGRRFLGELLQAPQRQLDQLQQRIDAQVRQSVEKVTRHPTFQNEIRRVEHSIKRLEQRLVQLKGTPAQSAPARGTAARAARPRTSRKPKRRAK